MTEEKAANLYVKAMMRAHECLDCAREAIVSANHAPTRPETVNALAGAVTSLDGADIAVNEAMNFTVLGIETFLAKVLMSQVGNVRDLINDRVSKL